MRGILLLAIGRDIYHKFAKQMAMSIKYHSDIPIQLLTDKPFDCEFIDTMTQISYKDCHYDSGRLFPGRAKLSMNQYTIFEETIYLDVDAICLKEVDSLFDLCTKDYHSQIVGSGTFEEKEFPNMVWAWPKDIMYKYNFKPTDKIQFINSSFQYWKKADELFSQALKNILDPIPVKDLRSRWGKDQPDELYMNIALAQLGIDPTINTEPVYFNNRTCDNEQYLLKNHYVLGLYGGGDRHFTHGTVRKYYDRKMQSYIRGKYNYCSFISCNQLMKQKWFDRQ